MDDFPLLRPVWNPQGEERRQRLLSDFFRRTQEITSAQAMPTADPSELALRIDEPQAIEKPRKLHDDITTDEWRTACQKVMRSPWLPY